MTAQRCVFSGNSSGSGGGIRVDIGKLTLLDSTLSGNTGGSTGGALDYSDSTSTGEFTMNNCTVSANSASFAAGMYLSGTINTIANSTISGNTASVYAGLYLGGHTTISNSTISGNTAVIASFGGIYIADNTILQSTIVAGNTAAGVASDVNGAVLVISDYNLIGVDTDMTGITNGVNSNQIGTFGSPLDPLLGALQDNGGPTQTRAITISSPAYNAGSNLFSHSSYDQRGTGYSRSVGSTDIGAYEVSAPPTITGVNPPSGDTAGGLVVTITGTNFVAGTTVTFGGTPAASVSVGSATSITCTTPTHTAGAVNVVVVCSSGTGTGTNAFTYIDPVYNYAPTDIALSNSSIAENKASGSTVGTLSSTDPDVGDTATFTLVAGDGSTDNASFSIAGTALNTAASFNFEAKNSYSIRVRVTDSGNLSFEKAFTITVTNVNELPVIAAQTFSLKENSANATVVGTVVASDVDVPSTLTYAISAGNTDSAFAINATTGELSVASSSVLNFEVTPTFNLTVQVSDNGTPVLSASATITVNLTDVNESPTTPTLSNSSIAENSAIGSTVGILSSTDPDTNDAVTFTLVTGAGSTDNASFSISGATLKTAVSFDFEIKNSYSIRDSLPISAGLPTLNSIQSETHSFVRGIFFVV